jgi:hypothetical protein
VFPSCNIIYPLKNSLISVILLSKIYIMRRLLLVACLLPVKMMDAQVTQRDILTHRFSESSVRSALLAADAWHPFPNTPQEWAQRLPDSTGKQLIAQAEKLMNQPFTSIPASVTLEYVRNGNRSNYERLSFDKRNRLFSLAVAESIEGKGRFMDAIANGIWNICEETYWGVTAHIGTQKRGSGLPDVTDPTVDLFGAETASVLALTDYLVGARLDTVSPLLRERIRYEANRKILWSYENEVSRYGYLGNGKRTAKVNNWNPWVVSNCTMAFLLLEKNQDRRVKLLLQSMSLLDLYINGLGDDGATDEGPSYWFAAGLALFDGLQMISDATRGSIQVFDHPLIQQLGSYIYKTHIDGAYFVNVADATPSIKADGVGIFRFGKAVQDTAMMGFGSWAYHTIDDKKPKLESFFRPRQLWNLLGAAECAAVTPAENKVSAMYLPSVELMTARSSDNLFVASHGGNNAESHNHNDVGDFAVYYHGAPVLIDAGKGTYMAVTFSKNRYTLWYNTSPYHNLPTINEEEQPAGAAAKATEVAFTTGNLQTDFRMNIANAYPEKAGVQQWIRHLRLQSAKNQLTVQDSALFTQPASLRQSWMTVCENDISTPGRIVFTTEKGEKLQLRYDAQLWDIIRAPMALSEPHEQALKEYWNHRTIWRIQLTSRQKLSRANLNYEIVPLRP